MMSVPTATVSAMPCTMYCDNGNIGTLSLTSATFTISYITSSSNISIIIIIIVTFREA